MKKYLKRAGAVLLGLTLAIASLTGCGAKQTVTETQNNASTEKTVYRTVDEIKESGTINIGVFSDKSPFGYVDEKVNIRAMMSTLVIASAKILA